MYLRYAFGGLLLISPRDDCRRIVDAMLSTGYDEELCAALDFSPPFVARLMEAGFLVMSANLAGNRENPRYILLPKLHLVRSVLFFENLHVKKSIRRFLTRYELRPDADFDFILDRCVQIHGDDWLTPPLVESIKEIRKSACQGSETANVYPTSFALYRGEKLVAGEFGVTSGKVYTSYSGYYDEANAGTVQMILTTRWLEARGFRFFDLGMPLDYKTGLGAVDINPEQFVELFRGND